MLSSHYHRFKHRNLSHKCTVEIIGNSHMRLVFNLSMFTFNFSRKINIFHFFSACLILDYRTTMRIPYCRTLQMLSRHSLLQVAGQFPFKFLQLKKLFTSKLFFLFKQNQGMRTQETQEMLALEHNSQFNSNNNNSSNRHSKYIRLKRYRSNFSNNPLSHKVISKTLKRTIKHSKIITTTMIHSADRWLMKVSPLVVVLILCRKASKFMDQSKV